MDCILSPYEYAIAKFIGRKRQEEAVLKELRDQHDFDLGSRSPLECHIIGAAGEIACARIMNMYWYPSVNTFKAPDLATQVQIRTRGRHSYDLLVRPGDPDDEWYVLVTNSGWPDDRLYRVHGYLGGGDAKQDRYRRGYGRRADAFFVPQAELRPVGDLIELVIEAQAARIERSRSAQTLPRAKSLPQAKAGAGGLPRAQV